VEHVNAVQTEAELTALRRSVKRGSPFGDARWQDEQAARLGIAHTLRPLGRPKKVGPDE
jgi:putative transposase